tara:strand:+ start:1495 stop:2601 length:1107 start_codon:yes stop_codon:yes gene_type:complete
MIFSIIINLLNVLRINLLIFFAKYKKKKIIFFYHPKKNLTFIHNFHIEYIFKDYSPEKYFLIYGHVTNTKIDKNYYNIKEGYIKFLNGIDFFISNNICDVFPKTCNKIYVHHNLYDDPWVQRDKEKEMCERLLKYDYILVATTTSLIKTNETFLKYNFIKKPKIIEVGYAKLDYLLEKIENKKIDKKSILIAPTGINGFPELTIINKVEKIIRELLDKTNLNIILRPHPSDRNNKKYLHIKNQFINNQRFVYDLSENYFDTYSESKLMITDLSGTAYTFSFLTLSPVIFLSLNEKKIKENEYSEYSFFLDRDKIGEIIYGENYLIDKIKLLLDNNNLYKENIVNLRKNMKYLNKSTIEIKKFIDSLNR